MQKVDSTLKLLVQTGPTLVGLASAGVAIMALRHSKINSQKQLQAELVEKHRRELIQELRAISADLIVAAQRARSCQIGAYEHNIKHHLLRDEANALNLEYRDTRDKVFRAYNLLYLFVGSHPLGSEVTNEAGRILAFANESFSANNPPPERNLNKEFGGLIKAVDALITHEETAILATASTTPFTKKVLKSFRDKLRCRC